MAGYQFAFSFDSDSNIDDLLSIVISILEDYFYEYSLTDDSIIYIQISFKQKHNKLSSEFSLEKPYHTIKFDTLWIKYKLSIPVFINEYSIGKPLQTKFLMVLLHTST